MCGAFGVVPIEVCDVCDVRAGSANVRFGLVVVMYGYNGLDAANARARVYRVECMNKRTRRINSATR